MIDEISICKKAISVYGKENQIWMAIEEMAELNNALAKHRRNRVADIDICEEIADVSIMMIQLSCIYGREDVINIIHDKLECLEEKLKKHN